MIVRQLRPTESEVQRIVAAEKFVSASIVWNYDPRHNRNWADFGVAVENNGGWELMLYGEAQVVVPYKVSYSLSWDLAGGKHRIFSLDVKGKHKNRKINNNEWDGETHKQIWKDAEPKFAYTPDEIIPEEPLAAFREFCAECNISFTCQIGSVPGIQLGLET